MDLFILFSFSLMVQFSLGEKRDFFHFTVTIVQAGGLLQFALFHTMKLEARELHFTSVFLCDTGTYSGNPYISFHTAIGENGHVCSF